MLTALRKIYDFAGNWQGVLKKSVAFSLLHSIFDMFQIAALFLILIGLTEGMTLQIYYVLFYFVLFARQYDTCVLPIDVCGFIFDF